MIITEEVKEKDYPYYVKKALGLINKDSRTKYIVESGKIDFYFNRVSFELDWLHIQCDFFRAWAVMEAFYGFVVTYEDNLFKIGGYETDEIISKTLIGLLNKLSRSCK